MVLIMSEIVKISVSRLSAVLTVLVCTASMVPASSESGRPVVEVAIIIIALAESIFQHCDSVYSLESLL